jgi:iduronate 2-sulfatase
MRTPILFLAAVSFIASVAAAAESAKRLNVLYIISDDLNNTLGCYGAPVIRTPNLDRLAARGVRFERAYCNFPVCNPSRVSFLSGLRPDTTRIVDLKTPPRTFLEDVVFIPEYFRLNGYRTVRVGKIYHINEFDDPRSWDVNVPEGRHAKNPPPEQILRKQGPDGIVLRARDEDTWEGIVGRKSAELLEQCVRDGVPFFVAAGFRMPHRPYIAPEKYYALYNPDELTPRPGPPGHLAKVPETALTYRIGLVPRFPEDRPGDTIAAYYAAISYMDAQVGVLLDTMDRLKLWDNTVVVFHSDHGYHLGEHGGLWHKMSLFEECARVPLLVHAPGRKPGVSRGLVELIDVYPTLAELCGLKVPERLQGASIVPLLDNPGGNGKPAVYTVVTRMRPGNGRAQDVLNSGDITWMGRTVFDGRWRYTRWPDGSSELYDHDRDPFEYENLAGDPTHRMRLTVLGQLLDAGQARPRLQN